MEGGGNTINHYRFVDLGNAPEFFASGLHNIEVMGPVARFVLYTLRQQGGELIGEPPLSVIMPIDAIGPWIALTLQRCGSRLILPTIDAARALLMH